MIFNYILEIIKLIINTRIELITIYKDAWVYCLYISKYSLSIQILDIINISTVYLIIQSSR
jgi:hypothetical protein